MEYAVNVVFSNRTKQNTDKSFYLIAYLGRMGIAFDSSRLENYPEKDSPRRVGAFIDGTFIACEIILNNREMDKRLIRLKKSQLEKEITSGVAP